VEARRPNALDLGCFLLVVAVPLAFTPFSAGPFADLKLVFLAAGTMCVWLSGLPVDRRLAWPALAWVLVTAIAVVAGVDPTRGMTASTTGEGGGLLLIGVCAYLVAVGPSIPSRLLPRIRSWVGWTALVVALLQIANVLWPTQLADVGGVGFVGSTLGNQLFASVFVAAGLVAVVGNERLPIGVRLAVSAILAFGLSAAGERSSAVLPVLGLAIAFRRSRAPVGRVALLFGWVVAMFIVWQVVETWLPAKDVNSATQQFQSVQTDTARVVVWRVTAHAWLERPILGWGPDTTQSAYLHTATIEDVNRATRGWADAHDIFLETAVTTGALGLLALLWLTWRVLARAVRAPADRGWVLGAAAVLGASALVEPLSLVLTPLLFLFAGIAVGRSAQTGTPPPAERRSGAGRIAAGVALGLALLVTLLMLAAATLEQWGTTYGETWAYRDALRLEPWRLSATEALAKRLAFDGGNGNTAAADEATGLIANAVADHPWDANVRLFAGEDETVLADGAAAGSFYRAHLARFPGDVAILIPRVNAPPGLTTSI
jgi:hypothetical protein